jgi:hypothetical protein
MKKNPFLALTYSKMKILKTNDYLNHLKKFVEQHFLKTLFNASESAKNTFFVTSPKLKILIKMSYFIEKDQKKSI